MLDILPIPHDVIFPVHLSDHQEGVLWNFYLWCVGQICRGFVGVFNCCGRLFVANADILVKMTVQKKTRTVKIGFKNC